MQRIPDDLMPLVRELAEEHLGRLVVATTILEPVRSASHKDRRDAEKRLAQAQRLDALVNPRRAAA